MAMLLDSDVMCESIKSCAAIGTNPKSVKDFNKNRATKSFLIAQYKAHPDLQQKQAVN
jgi:hypothetical protein